MRASELPPLPASPARAFASPASPAAPAASVDSRLLLGGQREVAIVHGDRVYRLRHTRNDKLILVK